MAKEKTTKTKPKKAATTKEEEVYLSYSESDTYMKIQKDLLDQLEANGTIGEHFTDLVRDYMTLWVTKCILADDIRCRGTYVRYDNGGGQKGTRKNDSVDQLLKTNAQMLKLLAEIGVKSAQGAGGDDPL